MKKIDIVIASGNMNKIKEYKELFNGYPISVTSIKDEEIVLDVEENGSTFIENSLIKARYVASKTHKIVIADDSGLCVHALDDFPGIYSARFKENEPYSSKHKAINEMLEDKEDKSAHFTCAIVFVDRASNIEKTFEGKCYGHIIKPIEGPYGFGYDPIFVPCGENKPFSLLPDEIKNEISLTYFSEYDTI